MTTYNYFFEGLDPTQAGDPKWSDPFNWFSQTGFSSPVPPENPGPFTIVTSIDASGTDDVSASMDTLDVGSASAPGGGSLDTTTVLQGGISLITANLDVLYPGVPELTNILVEGASEFQVRSISVASGADGTLSLAVSGPGSVLKVPFVAGVNYAASDGGVLFLTSASTTSALPAITNSGGSVIYNVPATYSGLLQVGPGTELDVFGSSLSSVTLAPGSLAITTDDGTASFSNVFYLSPLTGYLATTKFIDGVAVEAITFRGPPVATSLEASTTTRADLTAAHTVTIELDASKVVFVSGTPRLTLSDGEVASYASSDGSSLFFTLRSTTPPTGGLKVTKLSGGTIEDTDGASIVGLTAPVIDPYLAQVNDSAAHVSANFDALEADIVHIDGITFTNLTTPSLMLTVAQFLDDGDLIAKISSPYNLVINDTVANVAANLDALETVSSSISRITLTDGATSVLDVTIARLFNDADALSEIKGPHNVAIVDSSANVVSNFDALENESRLFSSVVFTDEGVMHAGVPYGVPELDLTANQVASDAAVVKRLTGPRELHVTAVTGKDFSSYDQLYPPSPILPPTGVALASPQWPQQPILPDGSYIVTYNDVRGRPYNLFQQDFSATGQLLISTFYEDDGINRVVGNADGLTLLDTGGNDHIIGGGANETFLFGDTSATLGSSGDDTLVDFASCMTGPGHDTLSLPGSQFQNLVSLIAGTTFTKNAAIITMGDSFAPDRITVPGMTALMMAQNPGDFTFWSK